MTDSTSICLLFATILPVLINSASNDAGCAAVEGGGWTLVRHVSSSHGGYHPATDNCTGTDVYGTYDNDAQSSETWSIAFSTITFNEFLFAFGDCSEWLITSPQQVFDESREFYEYAKRCIFNSSVAVNNQSWDAPYEARWYMRSQCCAEDPWISAKDHSISKAEYNLLYGEDSYNWPGPESHNGANVWIRYNSDESRTCETLEPSLDPTNYPSNEPSVAPSNMPSVTPSNEPSDTPSNFPSDLPSEMPSEEPSDEPSNEPSEIPSDVPTIEPSRGPSEEPSIVPSNEPSVEPTYTETNQPSGMPSDTPSQTPTKSPTEDTDTGKSNNGDNSNGLNDDGVQAIIWIMGSVIVLFCICCCMFMIFAGYLFNKNEKNKKQQKMEEKQQLQEQLMELTKKVDSFSQRTMSTTGTMATNANGMQTNVLMNTGSNAFSVQSESDRYINNNSVLDGVDGQNGQDGQDGQGGPVALNVAEIELPDQPSVQIEAEGNAATGGQYEE